MNTEKELNDVITAMAASNIPSVPPPSPAQEIEYDEAATLDQALQEITELIESNKDVIEETRQLIKSSGDVSYIEAFSNISRSQSDNLKNLVKLITEKEKNKTVRTVKEKELAVKEKLIDAQVKELEGKAGNALASGGTMNQTNVILTGSPEDALKYLKELREKSAPKTVDI